MSRVMMLMSAEGAALAETKATSRHPSQSRAEADAQSERLLRDKAITAGFSQDEVCAARLVIVGDFSS